MLLPRLMAAPVVTAIPVIDIHCVRLTGPERHVASKGPYALRTLTINVPIRLRIIDSDYVIDSGIVFSRS